MHRPEEVRQKAGVPELRFGARGKAAAVPVPQITPALARKIRNSDQLAFQIAAAVISGLSKAHPLPYSCTPRYYGHQSLGFPRSLRTIRLVHVLLMVHMLSLVFIFFFFFFLFFFRCVLTCFSRGLLQKTFNCCFKRVSAAGAGAEVKGGVPAGEQRVANLGDGCRGWEGSQGCPLYQAYPPSTSVRSRGTNHMPPTRQPMEKSQPTTRDTHATLLQ